MDDLPSHDHWLTPAEADRVAGYTFTKRREEVRLSRWTAKQALAQTLRLGTEPGILRRLEIRNAADGAPEVFLGGRRAPLSISSTDRADWAVCTVIGGERPIGCDLELVEARSDEFIGDYFTPAEQELVATSSVGREILANLVWSAKESALKVLRTGLRRDTRSVEVHVGVAELEGWSALYVTTAEGLHFTGWWRRFGSFVLTYVSAATTGPPVSLIEPIPLLEAVPSHSWLANPVQGDVGP